MTAINSFRSLVRQQESTRYKVYDDATGKPIGPGTLVVGHPTIGTGRALDTNGISPAEDDMLLDADDRKATSACSAIFGPAFYSAGEPRQAALKSMALQMGEAGLRAFVNMRGAIEVGEWDRASAAALASVWAKQTPSRARMNAEILRTGAWPDEVG